MANKKEELTEEELSTPLYQDVAAFAVENATEDAEAVNEALEQVDEEYSIN